MKFNPIDELEDGPKKYEPLPEGQYDYSVIEAEETVSTAGNDMFKIKLSVKNRFVYEYILMTAKQAWKLKSFCESIGIIDRYKTGVINAGDLVGCVGRCELGIEPASNGYDAKNRVKKWIKKQNDDFGKSRVDEDELLQAEAEADKIVDAAAEAVAKVREAFGEKEQEKDDLPF